MPVAVIVRFELPAICVSSLVFVVRVIWEFDVDEAVAFSELRVIVRSPETKMRGALLVTVFWPSEVTYVYLAPLKSVTWTVLLMVDKSELVNSALAVVLLEDEEPDDEAEDEDEDEALVPVPVSLCACTPSAARHSIHTGRDNMIAAMLNQLSRRKEGDSGWWRASATKSRQSFDACLSRIGGTKDGSDLQLQQAM